jgi:peroxiredoxin Q/BCP
MNRSEADAEDADDYDNDEEFHQKRQRSDEFGGGRGRGRGGRDMRGRGRGGRDGRGWGRGGRDGRGRGRGFRDGFRDRGRGDRGRFRGDRGDRGFRSRGRGFGRDNRGRGRGFGREGGGGFENHQKECAIKVGQDAPDFNVVNDKSESVSLKKFRGKHVVLFIYFKNGTYGSKLEQETFRDLKDKFDKLNAVILGASRDDKDSHSNTAKENNLNYSLLADAKGEITKAYDAIDENQRVFPSTFIISPEGKIAAVWPKIFGFDKHPLEVLTKLEKIITGETEDEENKGGKENEEDDEDTEVKNAGLEEEDEDEDDDQNEEDDGDDGDDGNEEEDEEDDDQ